MKEPMDRDLFLLAAFLPADRRAAMEVEANADDELLARIQASDELFVLMGSARSDPDSPLGDETLAFLGIALSGPRAILPEPVSRVYERIEARIQSDPELEARYTDMLARLKALDTPGSAAAQFERLSGLSSARAPTGRILPFIRRSLPVAAGLAFLILATAVVGRLTEPDLSRWVVETSRIEVENRDLQRSAAPAQAAIGSEIASSREMLMGIWPRYDRARLASLAVRLTEQLNQERTTDSLSAQTATTLLNQARVRILLDDLDGARVSLNEVLRMDSSGPISEQLTAARAEAQALLDRFPENR
jgi:hypothetical protein